jgi:hypothetical protein
MNEIISRITVQQIFDNKNCFYHFIPEKNYQLVFESFKIEMESHFIQPIKRIQLYEMLALELMACLN